MSKSQIQKTSSHTSEITRRGFLSQALSVLMWGGLVLGYGKLLTFFVQFLYPSKGSHKRWQFVTQTQKLPIGRSLFFTSPSGEKIVITCNGKSGKEDDFIAFSTTCPHLGCQVHWESQKKRFFCPCHNGAFNAQGKGTEGPPAKAGQSLIQYPLKIKGGLLFINVTLGSVT